MPTTTWLSLRKLEQVAASSAFPSDSLRSTQASLEHTLKKFADLSNVGAILHYVLEKSARVIRTRPKWGMPLNGKQSNVYCIPRWTGAHSSRQTWTPPMLWLHNRLQYWIAKDRSALDAGSLSCISSSKFTVWSWHASVRIAPSSFLSRFGSFIILVLFESST